MTDERREDLLARIYLAGFAIGFVGMSIYGIAVCFDWRAVEVLGGMLCGIGGVLIFAATMCFQAVSK